jgi:hypothetical protein
VKEEHRHAEVSCRQYPIPGLAKDSSDLYCHFALIPCHALQLLASAVFFTSSVDAATAEEQSCYLDPLLSLSRRMPALSELLTAASAWCQY